MSKAEEKIAKMYDSQLASQKERLTQDYDAAGSNLDAQQQAAQKQTEKNIGIVKADAQRAAMSDAEYYAASGLTSGARAQARLARDNQLQANVTALRTAQQETDAAVERQRGLLAKEYASAIRQAQAENDLQKAQALYEQAEKEEAALRAAQQAKAASEQALFESRLKAAEAYGENEGDYSLYYKMLGLTDEDMAPYKYNQDYKVDENGKPTGIKGHGLLKSTGDNLEIRKPYGRTSTPVMRAEDGTMWYWDYTKEEYFQFKP